MLGWMKLILVLWNQYTYNVYIHIYIYTYIHIYIYIFGVHKVSYRLRVLSWETGLRNLNILITKHRINHIGGGSFYNLGWGWAYFGQSNTLNCFLTISGSLLWQTVPKPLKNLICCNLYKTYLKAFLLNRFEDLKMTNSLSKNSYCSFKMAVLWPSHPLPRMAPADKPHWLDHVAWELYRIYGVFVVVSVDHLYFVVFFPDVREL